MNKELFVSSTPHETKVGMVEDDLLAEIYLERENEYTLAGSIYKGRVTRVLPGMQSAFVDIGLERDAFLYVSDFMELEDSDEVEELPIGPVASEGRRQPQVEQATGEHSTPVAEKALEGGGATGVPSQPPQGALRSNAGDREERGGWRGRRRRRGGRRGERGSDSRTAQTAEPAAESAIEAQPSGDGGSGSAPSERDDRGRIDDRNERTDRNDRSVYPDRSARPNRSQRSERNDRFGGEHDSDYGPPPGTSQSFFPANRSRNTSVGQRFPQQLKIAQRLRRKSSKNSGLNLRNEAFQTINPCSFIRKGREASGFLRSLAFPRWNQRRNRLPKPPITSRKQSRP